MPWTERPPSQPSEAQKCLSCRVRYWQSKKTHLCRRCEVEQGEVAMSILSASAAVRAQREADERMAARDAKLTAPRRILNVDGREFEVVWDGQTPLVYH